MTDSELIRWHKRLDWTGSLDELRALLERDLCQRPCCAEAS